jgi:Tfp pilus assembly protein PilP
LDPPLSNAEVEEVPGYIDPLTLEKHPLSDISLSAIVVKSNQDSNVALLEVGGVGYTVKRGDRVGSNKGIVREINETNVVIEEAGPDGKPSGKMVTLRLSR